MSSEMLRVV